MESLENRELLSVSAADFAAIKAQYEDLNLTNYGDYNIIEIEATQLTETNLLDAIDIASQTAQNDLIVVRTTAAQHRIVTEDTLWIEDLQGSVAIVSFGDEKLTIEASEYGMHGIIDIYGVETSLGGVVLCGGTASMGGGIFCYDSVLRLSESVICDNLAGAGGGIAAYDSQVYISHSVLRENIAAHIFYADGGGMYAQDSTVTIRNSYFEGNVADGDWGSWGGGFFQKWGTSNLTNVVFVGNYSMGDESIGGGMAQRGGEAMLVNVTIAGNKAIKYGAGFYVDGRDDGGPAVTYFRNSIASQNEGENYHTSQGGTSHRASSIVTNASLFVRNPGAVGSGDYGNLTLRSGASAINGGNNSYVTGIATDILGNPRIYGGTVDMGAYEYQGSAINPPSAPANFQSGTQTSDSVTLSWTAQSGLTGYALQYKESTDSYWTTWTPAPGVTATSATVTGLAADTPYDFRLTATNTYGSANSTTSASTKTVPTKPGAPTVTATYAAGIGVTLKWDAVSGAETYKVYRLDGDQWVTISEKDFTGTTFIDSSAATESGTYGVRAYNVAGYSNMTTVTIKSSVKPATPTVTATHAAGTGVTLKWNAVSGAETYKVYRLDGGNWVTISEKNFTGTTFTDPGASDSGTYGVRAYNDAGYSDMAIVSAASKPTMTTNFKATVESGNVKLSWNPVSGASHYQIWRLESGNWVTVGRNITDNTFTVTGTMTGKYGIRAYNAAGYSDLAETSTASDVKPAAPKVTATYAAGTGVTLQWNAVPNADTYKVYRLDGGNWVTVSPKNFTGTSFTDPGAPSSGTYGVRAYNGTIFSDMATVSAAAKPAAPIVSATVVGNTVQLTWDAIEQADTYRVWRRVEGGDWASITGTFAEAMFTDTNPPRGVNVHYGVRAYTGTVYGNFIEVSIQLPPT